MRQGNVVSPSIEIDLTKPFRIGGNPLLRPGGGASLKAPEKVGVPKVSEMGPAAPAGKEKEWVLPGPKTEEVEKPVPVGTPS
ncbi:MAG: hypothetical protein HYY63_06055, partial [Elusimicrobia bacterium]|nr:hypothetical protein [Elusimicrobiota bacterium]